MLKNDMLVTDRLLSKRMLLWYSFLLVFNFFFLFGIHYPTRIKYQDLRWKDNSLIITVPEEEMIKINVRDSMHLAIRGGNGPLKRSGIVKLISPAARNGGYDVSITLDPCQNIGINTPFLVDTAPIIDGKKQNLFSILFLEN
jgi:hypothetical protein